MDKNEILFVFGCARSGTTYVAELLADLFDFGMGPEGHFVLEFFRRLNHYEPLTDENNVRRLFENIRDASTLSIIRNVWPKDRGFDVSVDELHDALAGEEYADVVFAVFEIIAKKLGRSHIGTKNPGYTEDLSTLLELFPENSRFLNVVRDGRDVALSTMQQEWGEASAYACAKSWRRSVRRFDSFKMRVADVRCFELKYEELLSEPEEQLAKLEGFLNIKISTEKKDKFLAASKTSELASNYLKWPQRMAKREVERFEAIAGEELLSRNYELFHANPRVRMHEAVRYETQEVFRKLLLTLGKN